MAEPRKSGGTMLMIDPSSPCIAKNANYDRVMSAIAVLQSGRYVNSCACSRCVSDIAAIALNVLPPHYYVEEENSGVAGSPWIMVEHAVMEAIERVRESPRHIAAGHGSASDQY